MSLHRGMSLVGLLIVLACIVVLLSITLPAMRTATTGFSNQGGQASTSAWAAADQMNLNSMNQALIASGMSRGMDQAWMNPAVVSGTRDVTLNTTANFYSMLVMERLTAPRQLVSKGDQGFVEIDADYDMTAYDPRNGIYWDPQFVADLSRLSNVSYAHMPLTGARFDTHWHGSMASDFPLLGERGPQDGVESAGSVTCRNGVWSGHVSFADGHVDHLTSPRAFSRQFNRGPDGLFTIDDPQRGADAVLGFSSFIDEDGVTLQWD